MDNNILSFSNSLRLVAAFAVVGLGLYFLYTIADILLIFLAAVIFAIALDRPLDALVKRGVGRATATVVIYTLFLFITIFAVVFTVPPLIQEVRNLTTDLSNRVESTQLDFVPMDEDLLVVSNSDYLRSATDFFQSSSQVVIDTALRVYSGLLTFFVIFFLALFLNIQGEGVKKFIKVLIPIRHQLYATGLFEKIQKQVSSWLWGKTISSIFVAFIVFPGLVLLDIPYAITFTLLAFFLNYIPFVGPLLAGIVPVLLGFMISPFHAFAVAFLYFFANTVEGFIIIPLLLKQSIQLNPLVLIFAVLVGGRLGGALGILLSIPVAAIITLLYEEYHRNWYHRETSKQHVDE